MAITWLAPSARSPDAAALKVAAALLGNGESSRINQALVYRAQIAQKASFGADLRVDTGLLIAYAIAATGKSPDALAQALRKEIGRLADKPVPAAELAKVKTQLLTQALLSGRRRSARARRWATPFSFKAMRAASTRNWTNCRR